MPVVLVTHTSEFNIRKHYEASIAETRKLLDTLDEPVYVITDWRDVQKASLDDIIVAANLSARSEEPITQHPNVRQVLAIVKSDLAKLAVRGLRSATFGHVQAAVFSTPEEALEYVRSQLV